MSHSEVLGIRISTHAIWGDTIQPLMVKSTEMEKLLVPPPRDHAWEPLASHAFLYVREREASAPV